MSDLRYVKGLAEIDKVLETLPVKIQRNVARGGLRAGCNMMLPVARSNIHSISGRTAASLKVGTRSKGSETTGSVYSRYFIARFLEWGTKPHTITAANRKGLAVGGLFFQSVEHPGAKAAMGGTGFLRNAMDTQAGAAVVAFGEYMKVRLATKEGLDTAHISIEGDES